VSTPASTDGYDAVFPIGPGDRKQWTREIDNIFLAGVPRHLRPDARVYLRQGREIFWSAPVLGIVEDSERTSWVTGREHADGPTMQVDLDAGRRHKIDAASLPTPDGKAWHEMQGLKYVVPGCTAYVRAGRQLPTLSVPRRSRPEVELELALRNAGLPVSVPHRRLHLSDGEPRPFVEVDICVPTRKIVIEFDGNYYHRSAESAARDTAKTARLIASGYRVIRVRDNLPPLKVGESVLIGDQYGSLDDVTAEVLRVVDLYA
jgi:hypothetical protein